MIDVFRVGVHIGMTTNSSQVLSVMLRELTGIHVAAGRVQQSLGAIKTAAIGVGAIFVGWKAIDGIWHLIEHSRELNKELEKTKQLGGSFAADLAATRNAAVRTQNEVPTSTLSQNVRLAREVGVTIGRPDAAMTMLTEASKAAYVVSHFTGEKEEDIVKNLMRVADSRGQIYKIGADGREHVDQERLVAEMNAAAKGLILGGGFITSSDLLQVARRGGVAIRGQSPEAFYAAGVEAAIAMGASQTGVAETGLMQKFVGDTMTKRVAEHLTAAGLLRPNEWHSGRSGGVVIDPKVAQRFTGLMEDPQKWLISGEGGAAIKQYAAQNKITDMMAIFQLFGRQTVQRLVADMVGNEPQFARAREIYGGIPSVQTQYRELQNNDLDTNIVAVAAAWKSFTEAFSDAAVPLVIPILHGITDALHLLVVGAADYPLVTRGLIGLAGGLSSLMVLGGAMLIFNLAISPFVGGLRLLTGVAGLAATGAGLTAVSGGLSSLAAPIAAIMAILKIGSDHETPENRKAMEDLRKIRGSGLGPTTLTPQDGYGPDGRPVGQFIYSDRAMEREGPTSRYIYSDRAMERKLKDMPAEEHSWFQGLSNSISDQLSAATRAIETRTVNLVGTITVDGRAMGNFVAKAIGDAASRPDAGTTGAGPRVVPPQPGEAFPY